MKIGQVPVLEAGRVFRDPWREHKMFARMNRLLTLVAAGVMLGVAPLAHAFFTLDFDENGNGSISVNNGPFVPLAGVLAPDPSNGGIPALTYFLPASQTPLTNGDVSVFEPNATLLTLSDAIRFTDANGNLNGGTADRMIYYSDNTDGGTDLADTGFPTNLNTGLQKASVNEIGPEGHNGFQYVAGLNIYNGISDVPEPGTLLLLGIGLVLATPAMRRWAR